MKIIFFIGAGSFLGGISRYLLSQLLDEKMQSVFPYGTLAVNVLGCFCIGLVFAFFDKGLLNQDWKLVLATGVLGGFTTFSAFSQQTFFLLKEGKMTMAFTYVMVSVLLGVCATFLAFTATHKMLLK